MSWVVVIDDGVEATEAWFAYDAGPHAGEPFDRVTAEAVAEENNMFVQTRGFAKALPLTKFWRRAA